VKSIRDEGSRVFILGSTRYSLRLQRRGESETGLAGSPVAEITCAASAIDL
jgi:hypothetical protein